MTSAFSGIDTLLLLRQTAAQKYNHTSWVDPHTQVDPRMRQDSNI